VKRIINKIIIHFDKEKRLLKKNKALKSEDYYICRVCKHIYPEDEMSQDDESICKVCAKND